jgi:Bacterial regulatory protein, Fis family
VPGATIAELEKWAILTTLEACGGSTSKAATVLGVSSRKIQYKLHEYADTSGRVKKPESKPQLDSAGSESSESNTRNDDGED